MERFLPYGRQSISEEDIAAVASALREDVITRGRYVEAFEMAFAQRCNAAYAVAFSSGTAALQAAFYAGGVGLQDSLFVAPNTFYGTIAGAVAAGATPVFIDIDKRTGNIDVEQLHANVNLGRTRGRNVVVAVHYSGIPIDMEALDGGITNPDTLVIEDAAHALGSTYPDGTPVGCCLRSAMTAFSFHPVKAITSGEGGAVTTNDEALCHRLKLFRNNGIERSHPHLEENAPYPGYYEVHATTGNYNFTDIQGALALSQLERLDTFVEKRRLLMQRYRQKLKNLEHIHLLDASLEKNTAYHLCVVLIDFAALKITRQTVMEKLFSADVGTQVHYIPLYRHPVLKRRMGDLSSYFPSMETFYSQALSLPLFFDMKLEDVDAVADLLVGMLKR